MASKIRSFDEKRIVIPDSGEIHIGEVDDGYNITISEGISETMRIGIPFEEGGGICYHYWRDIVKLVQKSETEHSVEPEKIISSDLNDSVRKNDISDQKTNVPD
jgi:hypothetical protein